MCARSRFHVWLCIPGDHSPPGSTVYGIFWARILQWAAVSSSKGSSRPRDQTWTSCIAGRFFTIWAIKEVPSLWIIIDKSIHSIKLHKSAYFPCTLFMIQVVIFFSNGRSHMRWMWAQLGIVSSFSLSPLSMNTEDIIPVWRGSEGMRSGSACLGAPVFIVGKPLFFHPTNSQYSFMEYFV